jgi:hypothetical protein
LIAAMTRIPLAEKLGRRPLAVGLRRQLGR